MIFGLVSLCLRYFTRMQCRAHLSYIDQQSSVERTLIRTQPELRVIIRRYRELEITWRGRKNTIKACVNGNRYV